MPQFLNLVWLSTETNLVFSQVDTQMDLDLLPAFCSQDFRYQFLFVFPSPCCFLLPFLLSFQFINNIVIARWPAHNSNPAAASPPLNMCCSNGISMQFLLNAALMVGDSHPVYKHLK